MHLNQVGQSRNNKKTTHKKYTEIVSEKIFLQVTNIKFLSSYKCIIFIQFGTYLEHICNQKD